MNLIMKDGRVLTQEEYDAEYGFARATDDKHAKVDPIDRLIQEGKGVPLGDGVEYVFARQREPQRTVTIPLEVAETLVRFACQSISEMPKRDLEVALQAIERARVGSNDK